METAKVIGILGGMGPEATCDLFHKIIRVTPRFKPIRRDQDHLRVIVDSNPLIPDRTAAILEGGEDPVPQLQETARNLERAGAGLIAMPCNTAHYFWDQVQAAVGIPVLHMMEEVARALAGDGPVGGQPGASPAGVSQVGPPATAAGAGRVGPPATAAGVRCVGSPASAATVSRVGLLATTATVRTRLYHRALEARGIEVLEPDAGGQQAVMEAIYRVKRGDLAGARAPLVAEARRLEEAGADAIVAGCTEIPLVLGQGDLGVPLVDATEVLAVAAVRAALQG